jgi:hypothetical protein
LIVSEISPDAQGVAVSRKINYYGAEAPRGVVDLLDPSAKALGY